jgi:hypothetical protein
VTLRLRSTTGHAKEDAQRGPPSGASFVVLKRSVQPKLRRGAWVDRLDADRID